MPEAGLVTDKHLARGPAGEGSGSASASGRSISRSCLYQLAQHDQELLCFFCASSAFRRFLRALRSLRGP